MFKKLNLLRVTLAVLIIFIPLYPKFPLSSVAGTYVSIRLDDIIVTLSILLWLVVEIKNKLSVFKEPVSKLIVAYFFAILASFVTALFIYQTDPTQILLLHLLRRFEYMSLFFLTISTLKDKLETKSFYLITTLTTAGVILYGYGQKYFHLPIISTMNSEFSKGQLLQMDVWTRISSTFAGHYDLAAYMSVILVIVGGVVVTQKNIYIKILNIVLWLLAFNILTLTASRVSIFAFFGGICLTFILLRKFVWIIPVTLIFVSSIIGSKDLNQRLLATIPALRNQFISKTPVVTPTVIPTPTTSVIAYITPAVINRTTPVPTVFRHPPKEEFIPIDSDSGVARSGEIRFNAEWPRAITAFNKNVITGTGLGSITLATDNDYLRLLGESGLLGFVTFMGIMVYFIFRTFPHIFIKKLSSKNHLPIIFLGALITFLVNATLIDVFEASKTAYMFWIMMGFYYSILQLTNSKSKT